MSKNKLTTDTGLTAANLTILQDRHDSLSARVAVIESNYVNKSEQAHYATNAFVYVIIGIITTTLCAAYWVITPMYITSVTSTLTGQLERIYTEIKTLETYSDKKK
jgi:hypothetical protein